MRFCVTCMYNEAILVITSSQLYYILLHFFFHYTLRHYHLSKAVLPEDALERTIALEEATRPLTVIDDLMMQLEGNILLSKKSGTQSQIFLSELTQRMGSVNVLICDSGVYRAQSCVSLEQALILSRCHGLQNRNFRSSLSTLRKTGSLPYIEKKNMVENRKRFLKHSPW